jgi:signal transduction histidine kinase
VHDFPVDWNEAPPALKIFEQRNEMTILKRDEEKEEFSLSSIPELSRENIAAAVILPLRVEKELRGFLIVGYPLQYNYSEKEVRMLNSLAEKSSIAMVNAKLYNDLLEHEKELELLSAARVQVQEEERRRIAREIHDGLGQLLTAIKFNLEILEDSLLTTPDEKNRIDDMKKLLDDVMKEARELSYNLMPSVLEDFGLIPAVQLLCEQFSRQTGIQVQFLPHGGDDRFGADLEISIYRIVQEALTNIQKHASATSVELQIIASANSVRMTVEDNGKGFAAQKIIRRQRDRNGIGLASMRERTSLLGGTFTIESVLQHGTLLCVEIPIKKKESKP